MESGSIFDPTWLLADPITIDQAAALWCGMEPLSGSLDITILPMKPQLAAVRQMLVGAVSAGLLPADHSGNCSRRRRLVRQVDRQPQGIARVCRCEEA